MAEHAADSIGEGRLDLVPMIDCIKLLLLFFILTTRFTVMDQAIASLLPPSGQAQPTRVEAANPPRQIMLSLYPEGFQPSDYRDQMLALKQHGAGGEVLANAQLRIGGDEPLHISGTILSGRGDGAALLHEMERIHDYVYWALREREIAGAPERREQEPVVIQCFSGLSWKFALIAYDAVRAYEADRTGLQLATDPTQWALVRTIDFAPPQVRNIRANQLGEELYDVINRK
jgi:hypothetical protein